VSDQAHVEHNWRRRTVDVWLYHSGGYQVRFSEATVVKVEDRAENEPSLRIPLPLFELMMREAEGVVPAGTGTTEALRDTRQVRDRLLALVEKMTS
jgi:hypothetical protein